MNAPLLLLCLSGFALACCVKAVPVDKLRLQAASAPSVFEHTETRSVEGKNTLAPKTTGGTALEHEEEVDEARRQAKLEAEDEELEKIAEERELKAEHEKRASDKAVISQLRIDEAQQKGQITSDAMKETKMMERDAKAEVELQRQVDEREADAAAELFQEEKTRAKSAITKAEAALAAAHHKHGATRGANSTKGKGLEIQTARFRGWDQLPESSKELNEECGKPPAATSKCPGVESKIEKLRADEEALEKAEEEAEEKMGGQTEEETEEAPERETTEDFFLQTLRQRANKRDARARAKTPTRPAISKNIYRSSFIE